MLNELPDATHVPGIDLEPGIAQMLGCVSANMLARWGRSSRFP